MTIRMVQEKFTMLIWFLDMNRWIKIRRRRFDRSIKSNYVKQMKKQKKNGRNDQSKLRKSNNLLLDLVLQNKKILQSILNLSLSEDLKLTIRCKSKSVILEMDVGIIITFQVKFKLDSIGVLKLLLESITVLLPIFGHLPA